MNKIQIALVAACSANNPSGARNPIIVAARWVAATMFSGTAFTIDTASSANVLSPLGQEVVNILQIAWGSFPGWRVGSLRRQALDGGGRVIQTLLKIDAAFASKIIRSEVQHVEHVLYTKTPPTREEMLGEVKEATEAFSIKYENTLYPSAGAALRATYKIPPYSGIDHIGLFYTVWTTGGYQCWSMVDQYPDYIPGTCGDVNLPDGGEVVELSASDKADIRNETSRTTVFAHNGEYCLITAEGRQYKIIPFSPSEIEARKRY